MSGNYCISHFYISRKKYHHYDDSLKEDKWQLEVYLHALGLMKKNKLSSVADIGCGSGYKLMTYLSEYNTLGLELPVNVETLRNKYPDRDWQVSDFSSNLKLSADVIICSDVIEHLVNPDDLLNYIKNNFDFKYLVLSTPDRGLLYRRWDPRFYGPPRNKAHTMEWTFKEFRKYISLHFDVIDHRVTNLHQETQMIICKLKSK